MVLTFIIQAKKMRSSRTILMVICYIGIDLSLNLSIITKRHYILSKLNKFSRKCLDPNYCQSWLFNASKGSYSVDYLRHEWKINPILLYFTGIYGVYSFGMFSMYFPNISSFLCILSFFRVILCYFMFFTECIGVR